MKGVNTVQTDWEGGLFHTKVGQLPDITRIRTFCCILAKNRATKSLVGEDRPSMLAEVEGETDGERAGER